MNGRRKRVTFLVEAFDAADFDRLYQQHGSRYSAILLGLAPGDAISVGPFEEQRQITATRQQFLRHARQLGMTIRCLELPSRRLLVKHIADEAMTDDSLQTAPEVVPEYCATQGCRGVMTLNGLCSECGKGVAKRV